jgi:hypothetical protein
MSGTASIIRVRFLARSGTDFQAITDVPAPSSLNLKMDVNSITHSFDFVLELGPNESFKPQSHDLVEFYTFIDGAEHQLAVGFLEDALLDTNANGTTIKVNGRGLLGQWVNIPFLTQIHANQSLDVVSLAQRAAFRTYCEAYAKLRGRSVVRGRGAYPGKLLVSTNTDQKRAAVVQAAADLALNLIFENRFGQAEVYGRNPSATPMGTLLKAGGQSNVEAISFRENMSKVISHLSVFWVTAQNRQDVDQVVTPQVINPDERVRGRGIFQPENRTFSAADLQGLAGDVLPETRVLELGQSLVRRSNQNLGAAIVTVPECFFTDHRSGKKIPYEMLQDWQVRSEEDEVDKPMRLAGLAYQQDAQHLQVQLQLLGVDTLI